MRKMGEKEIAKCIEIADARRQHTQFDLADRTHDLNYAIGVYQEVLAASAPTHHTGVM